MSRSCEGFQPGTPLRQPAPATSFVPSSLRCTPGPAAFPADRPGGRGPLPTAPRSPSPGPAATAICSHAGGRTTPPWGPGPAGAVGHSLAPSAAAAAAGPWDCPAASACPPGLRPKRPPGPAASDVGSSPIPLGCGVQLSPLGCGVQPVPPGCGVQPVPLLGSPHSNQKPRVSDGPPTSAGPGPPPLVPLLSFFPCVFPFFPSRSFFPPAPPPHSHILSPLLQ